jgi:mycothiol synthase
VTGLRAITPADFAGVHALMRRIEEHDHLPLATPRAEVDEWLDDPYLDLASDTRLIDGEGGPVAWGRIWHRPSGSREERAFVLGGVDPAWRGLGLGRALLAWQVARAEAILSTGPPELPRYVRAQADERQVADLRLYARLGLQPARYNDELLRSLDDLPPRPVVPGIDLVPWDEARSEEARLAQNDAFADHWGSTPRDPAAWAHDVTGYGTRLDLSFFAVDPAAAGRIVAVCRNGFFPEDETVNGRRDGWIINLSVVRSHRRRGIASALLVASLEAFQAAGLTHSALGVDSANPTGAYGVYERLGWRPIHRVVVCQRQVG